MAWARGQVVILDVRTRPIREGRPRVGTDQDDGRSCHGTCSVWTGSLFLTGKKKDAIVKPIFTRTAAPLLCVLALAGCTPRDSVIVEQETDETVLTRIAIESESVFARDKAIQKLTDESLLAKVATESKDPHSRRDALRRLIDQRLLAKVAVASDDASLAESAMYSLRDPEALMEVAAESKHERVREFAMEKLAEKVARNTVTDQSILLHLVMECEQQSTRLDALKNLTDQSLLAKVAAESEDNRVRWEAVGRLTDQALRAKLAAESEDSWVRLVATRGLTDEAKLVDLVLASEDSDVREAATKNLSESKQISTSQASWAKLALDCKHPSVRKTALWQLSSDAILAKVAAESKYIDTREKATKKLSDQVLLMKLAVDHRDERVRKAAVFKLTPTTVENDVTDQAVLVKLVVESRDGSVRRAALGKLTDERVLAQLAIENSLISAAAKLTDEKLLMEVAIECNCAGVYHEAYEELTDRIVPRRLESHDKLRFLADFLGTTPMDDMRLRAIAGSFSLIAPNSFAAFARVKLATAEPRIQSRIEIRQHTMTVDRYSRKYHGPYITTLSRYGFSVSLAPTKGAPLTRSWTPIFPHIFTTDRSGGQSTAGGYVAISGKEVLADLVKLPVFTTRDCEELVRSKIPELRLAAAERLSQQSVWGTLAVEDSVAGVREVAVRTYLTDQVILAKVARANGEECLGRTAAVGKLTDQTVLAELVRESEDKYIREAAQRRIARLNRQEASE